MFGTLGKEWVVAVIGSKSKEAGCGRKGSTRGVPLRWVYNKTAPHLSRATARKQESKWFCQKDNRGGVMSDPQWDKRNTIQRR